MNTWTHEHPYTPSGLVYQFISHLYEKRSTWARQEINDRFVLVNIHTRKDSVNSNMQICRHCKYSQELMWHTRLNRVLINLFFIAFIRKENQMRKKRTLLRLSFENKMGMKSILRNVYRNVNSITCNCFGLTNHHYFERKHFSSEWFDK